MSGMIFNTQKYSIYDGPGIRTTVFLKGCPLSCSWCHNPESQSFQKELVRFGSRCIGCGECVRSCKAGALKSSDHLIERDEAACISCFSCAAVCFTGAVEEVGRKVEASELVKELEKDVIFYDSSQGGVTLSGGEPLAQPEFVLELLQRCKEKGIHTVLDTSGFGSPEALEAISRSTDLFLYDLKLMDEKRHIEYAGVSNRVILENLKLLKKLGKKIWIRLPLIPGINDDEENIKATADFISSVSPVEQVNLLPYHNISMEKYRRLLKSYKGYNIPVPTKKDIEKTAALYEQHGVNVCIGG